MTTTTEAKYQCTKCYHYFPAEKFDADSQNGHRDFLKCWCKKCVSEKAKETKIQKRIEERERKAEIAKKLALSHTLLDSFCHQDGYLFESIDLGDMGIKLVLTNPTQPDEQSSIILPPDIACNYSQWIDRSNEGKLPKERQVIR